jgi:hypothetical protein
MAVVIESEKSEILDVACENQSIKRANFSPEKDSIKLLFLARQENMKTKKDRDSKKRCHLRHYL